MPEQPPIDRAFFREAEDGATVFFPWGLTGRGYRLTGESSKKRASRAASLLVTTPIAIGTWIAYELESTFESDTTGLADILAALAAPASVLLIVLVSYYLWVLRFAEDFPESDLRVSREERLREAAEVVKPAKLALIGVGVAGASSFLIWVEPRSWWLGLLGVAVGVGLLIWSWQLKRAADGSRLQDIPRETAGRPTTPADVEDSGEETSNRATLSR